MNPVRPRWYSSSSLRRSFHEFTIEVIKHPTKRLALLRERAEADIWALVRRAWGDAPEYRPMVRERFLNADILTLACRGSELVAFSAIAVKKIAGRPVLVILGTVVDPDVQGRGLSILLNKLHVIPFKLRYPRRGLMAARTQNPRLLATCLAHGPVYPNPWHEPPAHLAEIAVEVGRMINPQKPVCPRSFVMRDAMPEGLSSLPKDEAHRRQEIVDFCRARLDYARGDAFIMVSEWRLRDLAFVYLVPIRVHRLLERLRHRFSSKPQNAQPEIVACSNATPAA